AGEGERGGEPGRLDAEKVHEPGNAVPARALDLEIRSRLPRARGLRADARVAGRERAVGKARPVAPDRGVETLRPPRVDAVVDALDPFHVRSEARLPGEVERHVHAQAAGLRDRVDQAGERRAARQGVVVAFRVELS